MKTFGFIFSRSGSKGVRDKGLRLVGGKSLIAHSYESLKESGAVNKIFLSTDSERFAEHGKELGVEIIDRPAELATDTASEWDAWQHAVAEVKMRHGDFERFISCPPTSPLRKPEDVLKCVEALDGNDIVLCITSAKTHPAFNMVYRDRNGRIEKIIKEMNMSSRQMFRMAYDVTTVCYVTTPDFILEKRGIWDGKVKGVEIPQWRALDIDEELDLHIARILFDNPFDKSE